MLNLKNFRTAMDFWQDTLNRIPEALAILWFSGPNQYFLSYQQLEQQSNALALQFMNKGIKRVVDIDQTEIREPIIGVYCKQSSPLWVVASLAAWKAGAAVLLLDHTLKPRELSYRLENIKAQLIITDEISMPESWMYCIIDPTVSVISEFAYQDHQINPNYLAYIAYTSGSTGKPKAVALNHAGIPGLINSHCNTMRLTEIDRVAHLSSLNFDPSWMNFFLMLAGISCVLWNRITEPNLATFFNKHEITTSIFVPTKLAELKSHEFKTLTKILTTGEEASQALLAEWGIIDANVPSVGSAFSAGREREIYIGYGPTEDTIGSMLVKYTHGMSCYLGKLSEDNIGNRQVFLLNQNESGSLVSDDNPLKEMFLAGSGLARGYIREGQLDHEAMANRFIFIPDPNDATQPIRIYRTGDLAEQTLHGLVFKGRSDRQIKLRGRRIELSPIETMLTTLLMDRFDLREIQVHIIAVYIETNHQPVISELVAIIEAGTTDFTITQTMLNKALDEAKLSIERPKVWYWLLRHKIAELGLLQDSGKFNIRLCETAYNQQEHPIHAKLNRIGLGDYVEIVLLPLEELILKRLKEELSIAETYPLAQLARLSFEELGGNSLFYTSLMEKLEKEFDVTLQERTAFQKDFGLSELATAISYQLVFRQCFKLLLVARSTEQYLFCFPPVSGDIGKYKNIIGENGKEWLDRELNLGVMGFTMPELLREEEVTTPFFIQAFEFYKQRHLCCNLNVMAEYAFSEMRRRQPTGPYFLSGYSWGCHFAFAVAQHLIGKGYKLGWLGLLDGIEPDFISRALITSYQILEEDIWGRVITTIAERFHLTLVEKPSMSSEPQSVSSLEKLNLFMQKALAILDRTEVVDTGGSAAESTLISSKEKLIQYIRSCLFNLMATVSSQYRILANTANNVTLFHTQAEAIESCMGTDATSWDKFFLVPISRVKVDCTHLAMLEDRNFRRQFLQELQQRTEVQTANLWHVPPKNLNFTGRRELLSRIEQRLTNSTHSQPIIITACHGLGGIGKTQLVIEYIYQHLDTNPNVFWFSATTAEDIERCYLELAEKLDLAAEGKRSQEIIEKVRRYLERQINCILIFDNAANYDTLDPYLPRQGHCQVLITSRNAIWPNAESEIEIDVFSLEDSRAYIQKILGVRVGIDTDEDIEQLAETLGHLPLALAQACGYIKEMRISIKKYLEKYTANKTKFLQEPRFPSVQDRHEPVFITWDITMEFVRERSPLAIKLLNLCAFVSHENIPEILFIAMGKDVLQNEREEDLDEAIALLCNFHLLSKDLVSNCFAIHMLVQEVTYLKLTEEEKQFYLNYVFRIINEAYPHQEIVSFLLENLEMKQALVPHMEFLLARTRDLSKSQRIIVRIQAFLADAYCHRGDWEIAQKLLEKTLEIQQTQAGLEHPVLVGTLYSLANLSIKLAITDKALEMLERAMHIIKLRRWGLPMEEFPILFGLGKVYLGLGDLLKAKELFEHALELAEKRFGTNHFALTEIKHPLSNVYGELGDHIKQKAILENILASTMAVYGEHHPTTAAIWLDLGELHAVTGNEKESYECIKKGLAIFEEQYGKNHPEIAKMLTLLGKTYGEFGHPSEALELFLRALQIMEARNNTNNPVIIQILLNLSLAYRDLRMSKERIAVLQRALSIEQKNPNSNIAGQVTILIDLAEAHDEEGSKEEAYLLLEQCEMLLGEFWVSKDLNIAMSLDQLGAAFGSLGETERAIQSFLQSIRILEEYFEEEHSKLVPILRNLEKAYYDAGETEKQITVLNRALSIEKNNPNSDYLIQADILISLAFVYYEEGEIEEVHRVLEEALRLLGDYRRSKDPNVAMILDRLGEMYGELGDLDKSVQLFLESIQILEAYHGAEHPSLVPTLLNLEEAYEYLGALLVERKDVLVRALNIEEKNAVVDSQRLSTILSRLGEVYLELADKDAACLAFERSLEVSQEIYGDDHPKLTVKLMDLACTRAEREPEVAFAMAKQAYSLFLKNDGMTVENSYVRFILKNVKLLQRLSETPTSKRADYWKQIEPFVMTLEYTDYYCKEGFSILTDLHFTTALATFEVALDLNNNPRRMFFRDLDPEKLDFLLRDTRMNNMDAKVNPKVLAYYGIMLCYFELQQMTSEECSYRLAKFKKLVKRESNPIYWQLLAKIYQLFDLADPAEEAEAIALSLTGIEVSIPASKSSDQGAPASFSFSNITGSYSPTIHGTPAFAPNSYSKALALFEAGNQQKALICIEDVLGKEQDIEILARTYILKARILVSTGETISASELAMQALELFPGVEGEALSLLTDITKLQSSLSSS